MKYFAATLSLMLCACDSGTSSPTQTAMPTELQPTNPPLVVENPPEQDDPLGEVTQPPIAARELIDGSFLINGDNDYWVCNYIEGEIMYWQAPVTFYKFGVGDVFFELQDQPTTIAWSIGSTLNIFGSGLALTTFNLQINENPISENGNHIGQLSADVAQGGQLACSKFSGSRFDV